MRIIETLVSNQLQFPPFPTSNISFPFMSFVACGFEKNDSGTLAKFSGFPGLSVGTRGPGLGEFRNTLDWVGFLFR